MPHLPNTTLEVILYSVVAVVLLVLGYQVGKWINSMGARALLQEKEKDLFTAQKGFKQLYEAEMATLQTENTTLKEQVKSLNERVEEYRKKAAGYGGLFSSNNKRADAMYALLMENEALEDALHHQTQKLSQERVDAVKEQLRATGYRRVLMSQLMNDERIKGYVQEIMADDKRLPAPDNGAENRVAHD